MNAAARRSKNAIPLASRPVLLGAAVLGFLAALFGTYWDDAWHTEVGRDTFFIAPHLVLYAGISVAGGALMVWLALSARRSGLRSALAHPPLLLALAGVVVTLGAAPIDNAWHVAFGRDSVIWSPPHMLGAAGSLMIAAGLLLEIAPGAATRARLPALVAGTALLIVATIPVLEYETFVPQFDLAFYLPVLAAGAAFGFGLIRLTLPFTRPALLTGLLQTALIGLIAVALVVADMPAPLLPVLFAPGLALDLSRRRSIAVQAVIFTLTLYAVYVPYLHLATDGLGPSAAGVAVGLPLALAGAWVALMLTRPTGERLAGPCVGALAPATLAAFLLLPALAVAHDPGQGEELTTASVSATVEGRAAMLAVEPRSHCDDLNPERVVARRAGDEQTGELRQVDECRYEGAVELGGDGLWFLYAEFGHDETTVETWIAAETGERQTSSDDERSVYEPANLSTSGLKPVAGVMIYALSAAGMLLCATLFRRRQLSTPAAGGTG